MKTCKVITVGKTEAFSTCQKALLALLESVVSHAEHSSFVHILPCFILEHVDCEDEVLQCSWALTQGFNECLCGDCVLLETSVDSHLLQIRGFLGMLREAGYHSTSFLRCSIMLFHLSEQDQRSDVYIMLHFSK